MTMDAWLETDARPLGRVRRQRADTVPSRSCGPGASCAARQAGSHSGWRSAAVMPARSGPALQLLVRRIPGIGIGLAYAPRGPVGDLDDETTWYELVAAMRRLAEDERVATLRIEPEAPLDSPMGARLTPDIWRPAHAVQPAVTRIIDLSRSEEELTADLRRKHRQYVGKAERAGIVVEWLDASATPEEVDLAFADFHAILTDTGDRAGFNTRPLAYYERVWKALAGANRARLYFATRDGTRLATLFHIACGDRVAELYGGSTPDGTRDRANYLVKWAAILGLQGPRGSRSTTCGVSRPVGLPSSRRASAASW